MDCRVAALLAMTVEGEPYFSAALARSTSSFGVA
jgi:hypothetical protein